MPSRHFSLEFTDLRFNKRQDMIDEVKQSLLEDYREEGEKEMKKKWHKPVPKSWQEAFIRVYGISYIFWVDYESQVKDAEEPDWNDLIEEYAEREAEKKCYRGMHHMEVEVEL